MTARILLRPEDLSLVPPGEGRLDGRVESCAFFGAWHELRVGTAYRHLADRPTYADGSGHLVGVTWSDAAGIAYAADPLQL